MFCNIFRRVHFSLVLYFAVLTYADIHEKQTLQQDQKMFDVNSDINHHFSGNILTRNNMYDTEFDVMLNDMEFYSQQDVDQFNLLKLLTNTDHVRRTTISFSDLASLYLPSFNASVNTACRRDLDALNNAMTNPAGLLKNLTVWPLQLVDSWGKAEDGLLAGNIQYMGFFYECLLLDVDDQHFGANFKGQYCTMAYGKETNASEDILHIPRMPIAILPLPSSIPLHIQSYATCMPSTCTQEELATSVNKVLDVMDRELTVTECQTLDQKPNFDAAEKSGIAIFSMLAALLIVATAVDAIILYSDRGDMAKGLLKYLLVFSISANLKKVFHVDTKGGGKFITCIHGIRFLSICWVIIGHQWIFSLQFTSNPVPTSQHVLKPLMFQIIGNAYLSVDTFFFMSGLLVAYGFMNMAHKSEGRFNPLKYYIHRVVRLMPPILVAAAFMATLSGLVVVGPISWEYRKNFLSGCRKNWWHDPLFITNLFMTSNKPNAGKSCMGQCWYTGADTQMYLFMPLLLLPLAKWPKNGAVWLALWTAISCLIPAIITAHYDLPPTNLVRAIHGKLLSDYMQKIYVAPWARASPYLVGAWTGYILYASSGVDNRVSFTPRMTRMQAVAGWVGALAAGFAVLFGLWPYNNAVDAPEMPRSTAVIYAGLHRAVWAVMLGWIVCACHWGYGGPINWFLSHPLWQPLSRLTYSFYLVSLPVQDIIFYSTHRLTYFTNLTKVIETAGALLISFFAALVLTLVSESPVMALEKLLLKPQEKMENHKADNEGFETEVENNIVRTVDLQRTFSEQHGINSSFA